MEGSPLSAARALWGRTGDEAPASAPEPTGLDEYLEAVEDTERYVADSPRAAQLRALAAFAAAPAEVGTMPEIRPGRVIGVDGPTAGMTSSEGFFDYVPTFIVRNGIDLDAWTVRLGKFSWKLDSTEQAGIIEIMQSALRRHLEEEHQNLIDRLAHANEITPVAIEAKDE